MNRRNLLAALTAGAVAMRIAPAEAVSADWPQTATDAEIRAALESVERWIGFYRQGDYLSQWRLTDPRIRRWFDRRRWREAMRAAHRRSGDMLECSFGQHMAASARELPCTEMGHCYREQVPYVLALIQTRYAQATPAQPEYCVAAYSSEGWRFGGGTILNRPLGEAAVILSTQDERRYTPSFSVNQ